MKRAIKYLTLIVFSLTLLACGKEPAGTDFTLNNNIAARFEQDEVYVNVSAASDCTNAGTTKEEILYMAEVAGKRFWNIVPSSRLKILRGQEINVDPKFETGPICESIVNDPAACPANAIPQVGSQILIACNNDTSRNFPASDGIIAQAMPNHLQGQFIRGAILLINDTASSPFGSFSLEKKMTIIAHEIGHTIGLGHTPAKRSLMYYDSAYDHKYLSPEDIKGVTFLYPKKEKYAGIAGCGTVSIGDDDSSPPNNWPTILVCFALTTLILRILTILSHAANTWRRDWL